MAAQSSKNEQHVKIAKSNCNTKSTEHELLYKNPEDSAVEGL